METLHEDFVAADVRCQTAQERQDFNLFSMLKPTLKIDGNQWCVLYGDDLQSGIAGFGKSPALAISNFNRKWYTEIKSK